MHLSKHFDVKELILKFRHLLLLAGGVAAASQAYALSIGSPRGNVYLGSAVDLSFPIQPDPGHTVDSSCVRAEVWMGDIPLLSKDVLLSVQPSSVRVRTTAPVYEPLVTLKITAGCTGAITRSYTLFADPPATMAAAVAPIDLRQLQVNVPVSTDQSALPGVRATRRAQGAAAPITAQRARPSKRPVNRNAILAVSQPVEEPEVSSAPNPVPAAAAPEPAPLHAEQPRLRIEPIEGLDAVAPSADADLAPSVVSDSDAAHVAINSETALAQLATASDARLAAMEEQLKTLQNQLTTNRTEISGLHNQLAQAQNAPLPTWIYVLLGMLALALATIAWLLQRVKQERLNAKHTWADTVLAVDDHTSSNLDAVVPTVAAPVTTPSVAATVAEPLVFPDVVQAAAPLPTQPEPVEAVAPLPISPVAPTPVLPAAVVAAVSTTPATTTTAAQSPSNAALDEVLSAQAMFDVQEQAEFYASIGENDHAIGILQNHIAQHEASSPLAYLELLQLLHRLSRTDAFAHASKKFEAYFNVNVPGFFEFANKGQDLATGYPQVLHQIEAQWQSDELPSLLRGFVIRDPSLPETTASVRFDLAAFDDLLKLYNDVKTQPAAKRGAFMKAAQTAVVGAPAALATSALPAAAVPLDAVAAPAPDNTPLRLEDANLDMLSTAPADFSQTASIPVSDSPYKATSHFKPDEALFDGLTLDWDSAGATPPAAAPAPDLQLPDLDAQLHAFLQEAPKPTSPPNSQPPV